MILAHRPARLAALGALGVLSSAALGLAALPAHAAPTAPDLGVATSFAVLAGAGVTNTGPTTLNGDLGTFPTTTVTGESTLTITGVNHAGDAVTQQAKQDLTAAYDQLAGQGPQSPLDGELGGETLVSGVYTAPSSVGLTGQLILDGQGNPSSVFVFQIGSTLTTATASSILLTNSAQACNVFFQVGSSATLGTGTSFQGTITALTDITATTGATVQGRLLARNGAVTLDTNTVSVPVCAAAEPSPTPASPTPASPTPASPTPASPTPASPTPASPTPASPIAGTPTLSPAPTTPTLSPVPTTPTSPPGVAPIAPPPPGAVVPPPDAAAPPTAEASPPTTAGAPPTVQVPSPPRGGVPAGTGPATAVADPGSSLPLALVLGLVALATLLSVPRRRRG